MSELIGTANLLSSAGHVWIWSDQEQVRKGMVTPGAVGKGAMVLVNGAKAGLIVGTLKATGASRAEANTAMNQLERPIEALRRSGAAVAWEDDCGHTGNSLQIIGYTLQGGRQYAAGGTIVLQDYVIHIEELDGGWVTDEPEPPPEQ
jgi:hypothetical protein